MGYAKLALNLHCAFVLRDYALDLTEIPMLMKIARSYIKATGRNVHFLNTPLFHMMAPKQKLITLVFLFIW